ncbi:mitochondrial fission factor-like [Salarias fasciatus]|uniref:mitochondrial fission factor-like n=1 Tax=Salarias fasciatus TaxID=181472 RepID=UPI00117683B5|nr:mitochondrial fission factor-like [Salarias fasciatus]
MAQFPDPAFMESININMRVPERLSVGPGPEAGPGPRQSEEEGGGAGRRVPPAYAMHIPDRLTYADTPDMSPRPLFRPASGVPLGLEPCWENVCVEALHRDGLQSPIRRSYSDQSFGRTPPGTPTHLKQALTVPRPPSSCPDAGPPPGRRPAVPPGPAPSPAPGPCLLSPQLMLQTARQLGQQASQRLLQAVSHKYSRSSAQAPPPAAGVLSPVPASGLVDNSETRTMESWSPEEEGGAAVEFIILRRQVLKMSRRLAALERHSVEQRSTELLLSSLLLSALLLNAWLWTRR